MKMTDEEKRRAAFRQAITALPLRLQSEALRLPEQVQGSCEELRLRAGQGMAYSVQGKETATGAGAIAADELQELLSRATRYSVHSFADSLQNGYVTLEGGHRLGLCGAAVVKEGGISGIRQLSSANLRIAAQVLGAGEKLLPQLWDGKRVQSTLIVSPPAWGKTTLLRDLIRLLSLGGVRVGVADERCELSGACGGVPQFDLGPTTDVMSGGAKAEAALLLLKTMSPAVLALDEITAPCDVEAVRYAAHCGAAVLATAHAETLSDLARRPLYKELLQSAVFTRIFSISIENGVRNYHCATPEEVKTC